RRAAALREAGARIVAATDRERHHIERDLRDGARRRLATSADGVRSAACLVTDGREAAAGVIERVIDDLRAASVELRHLSHGVHLHVDVPATVIAGWEGNRWSRAVEQVLGGVWGLASRMCEPRGDGVPRVAGESRQAVTRRVIAATLVPIALAIAAPPLFAL